MILDGFLYAEFDTCLFPDILNMLYSIIGIIYIVLKTTKQFSILEQELVGEPNLRFMATFGLEKV
jgi:hypothetical protein